MKKTNKRGVVLVINPGSTSTKTGIFVGGKESKIESIDHSRDKNFKRFKHIMDQYKLRKNAVLDFLKKQKINSRSIKVIMARGGLIYPVESGVYKVNNLMVKHLKKGVQGEHASNLGAIIAKEIADRLGIKAYVVDEIAPEFRLTGLKEIENKSVFHALNVKACVTRYAKEKRKKPGALNLIIAHMGGGISVSASYKGRIVYVNNAVYGNGPFTPERAMSLPMRQTIELYTKMILSKKKITKKSINSAKDKMLRKIKGEGGLMSYFGYSDVHRFCRQVKKGNKYAKLVYDNMINQIASEIFSRFVCFNREKIDQIILTGGIAHSKMVVSDIKKKFRQYKIGFTIYPGENEMQALADAGFCILNKKAKPKTYSGI